MRAPCPSRITHVTLYARGALVSRRVEVPPELPEGAVDLVVAGVTPLAEAGSVRAALLGTALERTVLSVEARLAVPATTAMVGSSVERVRELSARVERLEAELARLVARTGALQALRVTPLRPGSSADVAARFGDGLAAAALASELEAKIDARRLAIEEELRELGRARTAAELADAQATSAERIGQGHPTREITVRLDGKGAIEGMEITYMIPAARWWPVYTLRIGEGGKRAVWWLEALIAQLSGEDWAGVKLALSTADLIFDARLPELPSLRLGRAQPPKKGYRPAPAGLEQLFERYDRAFSLSPPRPPPSLPPPDDKPYDQLLAGKADENFFRARDSSGEEEERAEPAPARGAPGGQRQRTMMSLDRALSESQATQMAPMAAPQQASGRKSGGVMASFGAMAGAATGMMKKKEAGRGGGGEGGYGGDLEEDEHEQPGSIEPADAWLDFDSLKLAAASDGARRGRLYRDDDPRYLAARRQAERRIEQAAPTVAAARDPLETRGNFDHRYDADGLCEVPSDAQVHRVVLGKAETTPRLRWRTVPRETAEVYREAELTNPFDAPLLTGPVDVYVEGTLLASTAIDRVDRGGRVHVGMGVEERIRVARNVRAEEDTAGLLGGSTVVEHVVDVELTSSLGREAEVVVLDRVPVSDEKGVEIEVVATTPEAEEYDQKERGAPVRRGLRWTVALAAAGKARLELRYRITLPSKNEIVGGNRRD